MRSRVLILACLLALTGLVATAEPAAAMCYLDPDDPLPGTLCGVNSAVSCAKAVIGKGTCAV